MQLTPTPDNNLGLFEWLVGGAFALFGSVIGAIFTGGLFIWKGSAGIQRMKSDIAETKLDVVNLRSTLKDQDLKIIALISKGDERHEENIRAIGHLTAAIAALPNRRDFERIEDKIDQKLNFTSRTP